MSNIFKTTLLLTVMTLLLMLAGAGDELQGIKKGIVEFADLLVVNKADGDLAPAAQRAVADYRHALRLLKPAGDAGSAVVAVSALMAKSDLFRPLRYCGRNSIVIYLAFFLPMAASRTLLLREGWIHDIGTMSLIVTIEG